MKKKEQKILICEIADDYNKNPGLTFEKEYPMVDETDNKYVVINNNGKRSTYYKSRFKIK